VTAGFMWAPEMWNPAVANTATTSAWPSATAISAADVSPPAATAFPEKQYMQETVVQRSDVCVHYAFPSRRSRSRSTDYDYREGKKENQIHCIATRSGDPCGGNIMAECCT
jgi:hypothetical protein